MNIDWEDIFDEVWTGIKIIIFLVIVGAIVILGVNQALKHDETYPPQRAIYNGTNYTCISDSSMKSTFQWDFHIDWNNWWQYLLLYIFTLIAFLIIGMFIFGYIPVCGCWRD